MKCPLVLSGIYMRPKPDIPSETAAADPNWQETAAPVPDRRIGAAEIEATVNDVGAIEFPARQLA